MKVADPWHMGKTLHNYILVARADSAKTAHLPEGTVVYTPIKRSVVFTTAHCQLLQYLHVGNAITGVCDLKYILIPEIPAACKAVRLSIAAMVCRR